MSGLQGRYQGVDWRDQRYWDCNAGVNPFNNAVEDATGLAPMELIFVKVKHGWVQMAAPSATAAATYDEWYNRTATVRSYTCPCLKVGAAVTRR